MSNDGRREDLKPEEKKSVLGEDLKKEHKVRAKGSMGRNALLIVAGVVVVAAAVFGLTRIKPAQPEDTALANEPIKLLDVDKTDIAKVVIEGKDRIVVTPTGEEDVYHVEGMDKRVLEQDSCVSLYNNLAVLSMDEVVEEDAKDLGKYGLADPQGITTVTLKDGTEYVFELGDQSPVSTQYYFKERGKNTVYLLKNFMGEKFVGNLAAFHTKELPPVDTENGKRIVLQLPGQPAVRISTQDTSQNKSLSAWRMTDPAQMDMDTQAIVELLEQVNAFRLSSFVAEAENLADYGLDAPKASILYEDTSGGSRLIQVGAQAPNGQIYVRIDNTKDVYLADANLVSFLDEVQVSKLIDKFANIINIGIVDGLEITDGTTTYTQSITRTEVYDENGELKTLANGDPDYDEVFVQNGKTVQEAAFKNAYQTIIGVTISGMVDQEKLDQNAQSVLRVTYRFNNGAQDLVVEYLPYDVNNYAVRRDGQTVVYARKDLVDQIMPTLKDLQEGKLDEEED